MTQITKARAELDRFNAWKGFEPLSFKEVDPSLAEQIVLTTSPDYRELRDSYPGMVLAERSPRRRTLLPFPIGTWGVYAVTPKSYDEGVRIIKSDIEARRLCASIAEQEGGGYHFAASFFPDALIYAFWIFAAIAYVRRQKRKKLAEIRTLESFKKFRDACLEYRDRTGRFPARLEEFKREDFAEFKDAFFRRDFLCLSDLGIGVIGATAKSWRAPFAPWGVGRRMLVAKEDGSIETLRGWFAVNFFNDLVWTARKQINVSDQPSN